MMRNRVSLTALLVVVSFVLSFGQIQEPEFINDAIIVLSDSTTQVVPSENLTIRYVENAWKFKRYGLMEVQGANSALRVKKGAALQFIINAGQNNINPMQLVKIIKFNKKKKTRESKFGEVSTAKAAFGLTTTGAADVRLGFKNDVPFTAKKFGVQSYQICISEIDPGEYAICIDGSNASGQSNVDAMIVSTFGVDK